MIESYFAVLPLVDSQSAFWSLHPYVPVYGKTFPAIPFSRTTATAVSSYGTEERQRNGGNQALMTDDIRIDKDDVWCPDLFRL